MKSVAMLKRCLREIAQLALMIALLPLFLVVLVWMSLVAAWAEPIMKEVRD